MGGWPAILRAWDLEPSILLGAAALLAGELGAVRWRVRRLDARYLLGIAVLLLALVSPLDALSDGYLFTAHMVQHLLLILAVPPLLLTGLPRGPLRLALRIRAIGATERALSRLPVAWVVGVGTLAVWHLPPLYNAALASEDVHVLEHLCFLVSATIFWWPVFGPLEERRPTLVRSLVYVLTAAYANALVGFVIFAAPVGIYPAYLHPEDPLHVLALVREGWGLTPAEDQKVGALVMIFGGSFAYAVAMYRVLWTHRAAARPAPSPRASRSLDSGRAPRDLRSG